MQNKTKFYLIFLLIIILAASLRLYNIDATALWHDEAFSALLIEYPFSEMIYRIGLDVHPALYYILLRPWADVFGNSLFALRAFSAFFGVLTVWGAYLLTKEVFNRRRLGLLAALFVAINPFQINYGVEARMYTLGTFLIVFASYFLVKALNSGRFRHWAGYAIFLAASFHIHYYLLFSVFAHLAYIFFWLLKNHRFEILAWLKDKKFLSFIGAWVFSGLLYLPWVSWFLYQVRQVQENYWIPEMTFLSIPGTFYKMITAGDIYQLFLGTDPSFIKYKYVATVFFVIGLIAIVYFLVRAKVFSKWLIFFLLFIPFLLAVLMSFRTSVYLDRYFVFASVFYLIILAAAIFFISSKKIAYVFIGLFVILSLASFCYNWNSLDIKNKPGMAGAAKHLNENVSENNKILAGSSFIFFTFRYYNETGVEPKLFAPGDIPHFSGSALLASKDDPQKLENIFGDFEAEVKSGDTAYVLWTTGFGGSKPSEIPKTWKEVEEISFQDVHGYRGSIIVSKYLVP